jgi:hypothetical protein
MRLRCRAAKKPVIRASRSEPNLSFDRCADQAVVRARSASRPLADLHPTPTEPQCSLAFRTFAVFESRQANRVQASGQDGCCLIRSTFCRPIANECLIIRRAERSVRDLHRADNAFGSPAIGAYASGVRSLTANALPVDCRHVPIPGSTARANRRSAQTMLDTLTVQGEIAMSRALSGPSGASSPSSQPFMAIRNAVTCQTVSGGSEPGSLNGIMSRL